jgi:hypothetical protein
MKTKWIALSFADDSAFLKALTWFDDETDIAYDLPGERDIIIPMNMLKEVKRKIPVAFTKVDVVSAGDLEQGEIDELRDRWIRGKSAIEFEEDT